MALTEPDFLESLNDLGGRVAIVTGGAAGLGLRTTQYLARRNCIVYAASRNREKSLRAIADAEATLPDSHGAIKFHHLDLSTVEGARRSAEAFQKLEDRLDIVVANGGVSMLAQNELSQDGFERMFATNHLGHFVFVTTLLDLLKRTSKSYGDVRIVVTSSIGYRNATGLDYLALTQARPGDGDSVWDVIPAFVRYGNSKLANIYFTIELDRRLREEGYTDMYCNSCHPGFAGATNLGGGGFGPWGGAWAESVIRLLMKPLNSVEDASKTQTYLAASGQVLQQDVHGQFWAPVWSWTQRYLRCRAAPLTELARDEEKQKQLWAFCERATDMAKAT
ncbi:MAG: hypothetical protein LQ339_006089 [Xanthoria mediterranea]|nr:MAG: hypothetical protein LQ339_006089 [Xanthoria mediterranea]